MQKEFASLWLTVQELNKLDASKEQALAGLVADRDAACKQRDAAEAELVELAQSYKQLQFELQVNCYRKAAAELPQSYCKAIAELQSNRNAIAM